MLKSVVIGIFTMNLTLLVHGVPIEAEINSDSSDIYDYLERPQCKDKNSILCEEVEEYPHDEVILALGDRKKIEVPNQYGEKDNEDSICQTDIYYRKPRAMNNLNDVKMYIVNVENVYTQVLREEVCRGENSTCDNVVSVYGYKSYCQQSYTYQSLLVYDRSFQIGTDIFKVPSGCCCTTKRA